MKHKLFYTATTILIIVILVTLVYYSHLISKIAGRDYYQYEIELKSNVSGNYTVYAPIAIDNESKNQSKIMDGVKIISGKGSLEIIETTYGKALKIAGNSGTVVSSTGYEYLAFSYPSMTENTSNPIVPRTTYGIWVYCNRSVSDQNITFHFFLYVWHNNANRGISVYSTGLPITVLSEGWNDLNVTVGQSIA